MRRSSFAARTELPRVAEVLDAAHAETGTDDISELGAFGRDDQIARPREHEAGGEDRSVHLRNRDLAEVAPTASAVEVVVPLLQHQRFGGLPSAAVDLARRVLLGPGKELAALHVRAHVVAGGEHLSDTAEDHDAHRVVLFGSRERVVELDEESAILRVARLGAVEHDPRDPAVVDRFVGDELSVDQGDPLRRRKRAQSGARG